MLFKRFSFVWIRKSTCLGDRDCWLCLAIRCPTSVLMASREKICFFNSPLPFVVRYGRKLFSTPALVCAIRFAPVTADADKLTAWDLPPFAPWLAPLGPDSLCEGPKWLEPKLTEEFMKEQNNTMRETVPRQEDHHRIERRSARIHQRQPHKAHARYSLHQERRNESFGRRDSDHEAIRFCCLCRSRSQKFPGSCSRRSVMAPSGSAGLATCGAFLIH